MPIDPKKMPEMNEREFKDLTKGRKDQATNAYRARTGCTPTEAQAVADYWYKLGFS